MTESQTPRRGRPPSESADSHEAILTAVEQLLREMPFRDLTMEKVANQAKVGKPTLYRWWPTKAALATSMFNERAVPQLPSPEGISLEEFLRRTTEMAINAFNGFFGKVSAELLAEAQSDPDTHRELLDTFVKPRRAVVEHAIADAQQQGLAASGIGPRLITDLIYAPIYYNHMLKLRPLTQDYGRELLDVAKLLLRL